MNFPFYIARRYVFAKKSHNAINIIAIISVVGIMVGTIAFIVVLSVFNGFDSVVRSLFNSFYADIEIVPSQGKTFFIHPDTLKKIQAIKGVENIAQIAEENTLVLYDDRQTAATVRGVSDTYDEVTGIDTMIFSLLYW